MIEFWSELKEILPSSPAIRPSQAGRRAAFTGRRPERLVERLGHTRPSCHFFPWVGSARSPTSSRCSRLHRGAAQRRQSPLFRSAIGKIGVLTGKPMNRVDAYRMVRPRTADAGFKVKLGCHVFWATGITAYLEAGTLENAQAMAAHESPRITSWPCRNLLAKSDAKECALFQWVVTGL